MRFKIDVQLLIAFTIANLSVLPLQAFDRYVDTTGSDTLNDCLTLVTPCLTVQHAIDQSLAGDDIHIAAGTYSVVGLISINKTVRLLGAQAGVDARTRVASESILINTQGISLSADNIVIDGLTIEGSLNNAFTGYGVWINPNKNGTQFINNIVQNNIAGLGLSNAGTTQALVQHNLFQSNNLPGAVFGTAIYTDEFVSGQVKNVLINENKFYNNQNAGIGFSSTDSLNPSLDITITNNTFDLNGRAMYFLNAQNITVMGNTITNTTTPTDGGASSALTAFGGVVNLDVTRNHFHTGQGYGIRIRNVLSGDPPPPNMNITIHLNNFIDYNIAALNVDSPFQTPADFATCNWWDSTTGPTNAIENPSGVGEVVSGFIVNGNFNAWLLAIGPDAPCGVEGMVSVDKEFHPSQICVRKKSTLTITLANSASSDASIESPFIDELPAGLRVKGQPQTNCKGPVSASIEGSVITLQSGVIPAHGSCTIRAKVTAENDGEYVNSLGSGVLETDHGINMNEVSEQLTVVEEDEGYCNEHEEEQAHVPAMLASALPSPAGGIVDNKGTEEISDAPNVENALQTGCTHAGAFYQLYAVLLLILLRKRNK